MTAGFRNTDIMIIKGIEKFKRDITMGEIWAIVNPYVDSLKKSSNPEEDLKKDKIVKGFLSSVHNEEMISDFHRTHEIFHAEYDFEEYVYKNILMLNTDVLSEYRILESEAGRVLKLIEKRKDFLVDEKKKLTKSDGKKRGSDSKQSIDYKIKKYQDLISQTGRIESEVKKMSSTEGLIDLAISNSRRAGFGRFTGLTIFGRKSFSYAESKIKFQDADRRRYIDFGNLPIPQAEDIIALKDFDHEEYIRQFGKIITDYQVVEKIIDSVRMNPLLSDRYHIIAEAMKYFRCDDFQMFSCIIVPQIEGLFKIYMHTMHIEEETRSISDVVAKIYKKEEFFEYLYFEYDFPVFRNQVAHGDVIDISREQAYGLLMDCYWVISKVDSDERDYMQWMKWLDAFSSVPEKKRICRILDYFADDIESKQHLENLSRFLSHSYSTWIKKFDLYRAGEEFGRVLASEELYEAIWNKNTPHKVGRGTEKVDNKEFKVVSINDEPRKYEDFVELMHKNKKCSDEWYDGYKAFINEQEKRFEELLEGMKSKRTVDTIRLSSGRL